MKTTVWTLSAVILLLAACKGDDPDVDPPFADGDRLVIDAFAGSPPGGHDGDGGPAKNAKFGWVTGLSIDASGNLYVSDGAADVIRKIGTDNVITTVAGKYIGMNPEQTQYEGDGGPATNALLNVPFGNAVDPAGNIYISDAGNNVLRKVNTSGVISTFAGKYMEQGHTGDGGPASEATIWNPQGIAADDKGNIYFADSQNHTIRKISTDGIITTIAGIPGEAGYSGDGGPATSAKLSTPQGICVSGDDIFISDNNSVVRRISAGKITTVAGTGVEGFSGDGGKATEATLRAPRGIAIALDGTILVCDAGNNRIRAITPESNVITTIAGDGVYGNKGDGGPAVTASLANPYGIVVDKEGNIYVADTDNAVIRIIKREE